MEISTTELIFSSLIQCQDKVSSVTESAILLGVACAVLLIYLVLSGIVLDKYERYKKFVENDKKLVERFKEWKKR